MVSVAFYDRPSSVERLGKSLQHTNMQLELQYSNIANGRVAKHGRSVNECKISSVHVPCPLVLDLTDVM